MKSSKISGEISNRAGKKSINQTKKPVFQPAFLLIRVIFLLKFPVKIGLYETGVIVIGGVKFICISKPSVG